MHARLQGFAHQELEGALGSLQLVALVFHLLDAVEHAAPRGFVQPIGQTVLLELVGDVPAPGEVADQHPLLIADELRNDVLVGGGILQHRRDVHATLVRERALADERLVAPKRQIRQLGDELADRRQTSRASPTRWSCGPSSARGWR